ncbi:MAG: hypothetical protein WKF59_12810 [Chitinophagaceae bacterium]
MAIAIGYVILHAFVGVMVGVFAGSIVRQSKLWSILHKEYLIPYSDEIQSEIKPVSTKKKKNKIHFCFYLDSFDHFIPSVLFAYW